MGLENIFGKMVGRILVIGKMTLNMVKELSQKTKKNMLENFNLIKNRAMVFTLGMMAPFIKENGNMI